MRYLLIAVLTLSLTAEFLEAKDDKIDERLQRSAEVLYEIISTPDKSIPQDLLNKSVCVGVIPGEKKVAFVVGGNYGRGAIACRRGGDGPWGAPSMIAVRGGSFGFQWGGTETDVVVVVMNPSGIRRLLKTKGELGADVSVAAGPVGRTASADTDLAMTAEILTYSRSRGLFAGVALKGAAVTPDGEANTRLYGHFVDPEDLLVEGKGEIPPPAQPLINELEKYSPRGGQSFAPIQAPKQGTTPPPAQQAAPPPAQSAPPAQQAAPPPAQQAAPSPAQSPPPPAQQTAPPPKQESPPPQ